ncbi:MAG: hypothetical protein JJ863_00840 [Deltaproteobacteria bacterium]|nr:hypothetical protein [Deltaproteobacteria bacterium]
MRSFLLASVILGCGSTGAPADLGGDASLDGGLSDAATADGGVADGGSDGGHEDAGESDAGLIDMGPPCDHRLPPTDTAPLLLSETGLYDDIVAKTVASDMRLFAPRFALWSDGAEKTRWLHLPECGERIDNRDPDHWSFPVGTRAFKEFAVDGKRIETRLVHRFGPGADDFLYAHYLWNEEESEAFLVTADTPETDRVDPRGTTYTVPDVETCPRCHGQSGGEGGGLPSRFLGVGAVQLSHGGDGITHLGLSAEGRLFRPVSEPASLPGNATTLAALGYLHANCGFCHNETVDGVSFPANPFSLFLSTDARSPWNTGAYRTAVDVPPIGFSGSCDYRVAAGSPETSCAIERMSVRDGSTRQMPPIDTRFVHSEGIATLEAWIRTL